MLQSEEVLGQKEPTVTEHVGDVHLSKNGDTPIVMDPKAAKKLLHKVDRNLLPILFLLQLCCFIDRINIGNARLQGLEKDLGMEGNQFNIALFVFFIPYILLEVPSNMLLKRCRPSIYISSLVLVWGVITICHGVTASFGGLVACRVLMGVFEAGFLPGCIYILSMFYQRHTLQTRFTIYFSSSIVAGAFSGLLAYAISKMDGVAGYSSWRWIFIIEGAATVLIALAAFWLVPDWPETAKFLKPHERELLIHQLTADRSGAAMNHFSRKTAKRVFSDSKIYLGIGMYLGIVTTTYAGAFFIPTILSQLGWTAVRAQLMSIPIYMFAMLCTLFIAVISDKTKHRFGFIVGGCCVATIGYIILLDMLSVAPGVRYFALFLYLAGGFTAHPITVIWLSNNVAGHYKTGISAAMQVGFGNLSGIIAANIYITEQAPTFKLGYGVGLGMVWVCVVCAVAMLVVLKRENQLRDAGGRDDRLSLPKEELENLGDDHPAFRFTY